MPIFKITAIVILSFLLLLFGCSGQESDQTFLTTELPLHLEEHVDAAKIEASEIPKDTPQPVIWNFDEPQSDWQQISPFNKEAKALGQIQSEDVLRLVIDEDTRGFLGSEDPNRLGGIIYVNLPDWKREEWKYISIKARTADKNLLLGALFNVSSQSIKFIDVLGDIANLEGDNTVHTYILRADWSRGHWDGPWRQFGIALEAQHPASLDIISISITPKVAKYSALPIGVTSEKRNNVSHPSLYIYTPGKLSYLLKIPNEGRLEFGLGVLKGDSPVTFRSTIKPKGKKEEIVFEETYENEDRWIYRSVDLSSWRSRKVSLALEANAERPGTIAFWANPTIWRERSDIRPNFIIIVLDALRADHMSSYGYDRKTTPNIERMLNHSITFKNAYSQAAATPGSTASLFTSTYVSAHGVTMPGNPAEGLPIIDRLPTLAEVMRHEGYSTKAISVTDWVSVETGYGKGFDDFELVDLPASWDRKLDEARVTAECIVDFLRGDLRKPFFLYAHMPGPHWPYDPPEEFNIFQNKLDPLPPNIAKLDSLPIIQTKDFLDQLVTDKILSKEGLKYLIDRYDGAIYQNDSALKEVFDEIRKQGLFENTMIIITADHGDQLMEHGWIGHWRPYNDTLHVPLIINYPPLFKNRELRDDIVETIGIGPTILAQAKIEKPTTFKGDDLTEGERKDYAVTEGINWWKIQNLEWSLIFKYQENAYELYDLRNDPDELHNIADQHEDIVKTMESQIKSEIQASITKIQKVPLDPKTIERLKALGYFK